MEAQSSSAAIDWESALDNGGNLLDHEPRLRLQTDMFLQDFAVRMLRRLSSSGCGAIAKFAQATPLLDFGSACSGTDCPALVLEAIKEALRAEAQMPWDFKHRFSAEKSRGKQGFIATVFNGKVEVLFNDMLDLPTGSGRCIIAKKQMPVPRVDLLVAGFPAPPCRP